MIRTPFPILQLVLWAATLSIADLTVNALDHSPATIDSARTLIVNHWQAEQLPGLSVVVAAERRLIWADAEGFTDLEERVPMWPQCQFRMASILKPITAASAALLYSQGLLDADAQVQQYIADFLG